MHDVELNWGKPNSRLTSALLPLQTTIVSIALTRGNVLTQSADAIIIIKTIIINRVVLILILAILNRFVTIINRQ